jgi:hypothetical protein
LLGIPPKKILPLLITLGYPEEDYQVRKKDRKDFSTVCSFNGY